VETAAAMEIDKGSLRQFSLDDFHRCLDYAELGIIQVIPSAGLFRVEWVSAHSVALALSRYSA